MPSKPSIPGKRQTPSVARKGWTRAEDERAAASQFGQKLRKFREDRGLTLAEGSKLTGIPAATLSRIENNKMAPTFGVLVKIMHAFDVNWAEIIAGTAKAESTHRVSHSLGDKALRISARSGTYVFPHGDPSGFSFNPLLLEVDAIEPDEFGGLVGHVGVEFCYVLDGSLRLHFEGKRPKILRRGESVIFESVTPHAYTKAGNKAVRLLIVSTGLANRVVDVPRARTSTNLGARNSRPKRKRRS